MPAGHCLQFNSIRLSVENTKIVPVFMDMYIWTCGPGGEKMRLEKEDVREANLTCSSISCL